MVYLWPLLFLFKHILGIGIESTHYVGCYIDSKSRLLPERMVSKTLTPDLCMGYCQGKGYPLAGLEVGEECFCGENLKSGTKVPDSECSFPCSGDKSATCGNNWRLSVYKVTSPGQNINPVQSYYLGCFEDDKDRVLSDDYVFSSVLTPEYCINYCRSKGHRLAGMEVGVGCHCGFFPGITKNVTDEDCNFGCSGDDSLKCGGNWRLSVYKTEVSRKGVNPIKSHYVGCYLDYESKQLNGFSTKHKSLTPDYCEKICFTKGFTFAGVGSECFCGNSLEEGTQIGDNECNKPCSGDDMLTCGGNQRISVYRTFVQGNGFNPVHAKYLGCYKDSNERQLLGIIKVSKLLTPDYCVRHCNDQGYRYAGLEVGVQCFCGDRLQEGTKVTENECNIGCGGDGSLKCGDHWRLSVYKTDIDYHPSSYYIGCYEDYNEDRFFSGISVNSEHLTTDFCLGFCYRRGYSFAGTEYGEGCFCGNSLKQKDRVAFSECNIPCGGDNTQICGGHWRLSVYKTGITSSKENNYHYDPPAYVGCFTDDDNRQIVNARKDSLSLTPDVCSSICYRKGFRFAGLEVGQQCFCGDKLKGGTVVDDKECSVSCSGDDSLKCGGHWRLSVYRTQIPDNHVNSHYKGCYDGNSSKVLDGTPKIFKHMTIDYCIGFCHRRGYKFAGMYDGDSCYCGHQLRHENLIGNSKCDKPCLGDEIEYCGGRFQFSVYETGVYNINIIDKSTCQKSDSYTQGNIACKGEVLFEEDFNSGLVECHKWSYSRFMPSVPDGEFVVLGERAKNIFVKDGIMRIRPTLSPSNNVANGKLSIKYCTGQSAIECEREAIFYFILPPVESARIHTKNSFSFRYGKVEIRAKLPLGDWIVPELWLIPKDDFYGPHYSSGKIRVAMARGNENLNSENIDLSNSRLEAGVLMGSENDVQEKMVNWTNSKGWHKEFHNFTLLWTPDNLSFSVDDYPAVSLIDEKLGRLSELLSFKKSPIESWGRGSNVAPFDKEFSISLGLSVGGIRDFPDDCLNRAQRKPWSDSDAKALLNFWMDKDNWYDTWKIDESDLQVDYVRVTAL